jgi:hypothetical protein
MDAAVYLTFKHDFSSRFPFTILGFDFIVERTLKRSISLALILQELLNQ